MACWPLSFSPPAVVVRGSPDIIWTIELEDCAVSQDTKTLKEDISYMRRLAETGRRGPILGGAFLAAAGLVFGAACFVHWAAMSGRLPIGGWGILYLWLAAIAVFAVVWFVLFFRFRAREQAAPSATNAAFGLAWSICAVGILMSYASVMIVAHVLKAPIVLNAYLPIIFTFYGVAWAVCAAMARRRWMYVPAVASACFALILAALVQSPLEMAVMGLALLLLLTAPGLKLMRQESN